ncbi:hypothetical protein E5678_03330 [Hydrogenophaga sp. PAMC20947]|nr:hypothetical protein E5678_03330 [Hydrogenophaga sp. PAMC20947]
MQKGTRFQNNPPTKTMRVVQQSKPTMQSPPQALPTVVSEGDATPQLPAQSIKNYEKQTKKKARTK